MQSWKWNAILSFSNLPTLLLFEVIKHVFTIRQGYSNFKSKAHFQKTFLSKIKATLTINFVPKRFAIKDPLKLSSNQLIASLQFSKIAFVTNNFGRYYMRLIILLFFYISNGVSKKNNYPGYLYLVNTSLTSFT